MTGISHPVRGFRDWDARFEAFYTKRPHPAFTVIDKVTPPFDAASPPPIEPVRVSLDDIDAIRAYVATIEPADLSRPIQLQ